MSKVSSKIASLAAMYGSPMEHPVNQNSNKGKSPNNIANVAARYIGVAPPPAYQTKSTKREEEKKIDANPQKLSKAEKVANLTNVLRNPPPAYQSPCKPKYEEYNGRYSSNTSSKVARLAAMYDSPPPAYQNQSRPREEEKRHEEPWKQKKPEVEESIIDKNPQKMTKAEKIALYNRKPLMVGPYKPHSNSLKPTYTRPNISDVDSGDGSDTEVSKVHFGNAQRSEIDESKEVYTEGREVRRGTVMPKRRRPTRPRPKEI